MTVNNIIDKSCKIQNRSMLIDTNVLLFYFYDKVNYLGEGGEVSRIKEYSSFLGRLLDEKVAMYTHKISISEFVNEIYMTELKLLYVDKKGSLQGNRIPERKKFVRENLDKDKIIRNNLLTYIDKVRKHFVLIDGIDDLETLLANSVQGWLASRAEMADSIMIAEAKEMKIEAILSDDSDMVSFAGFNLYTANPRSLPKR